MMRTGKCRVTSRSRCSIYWTTSWNIGILSFDFTTVA
jgi:hypothetical protein